MPWDLVCPCCRGALELVAPDARRCPACQRVYPRVDGIWRLLAPGRAEALAGFVAEYETVRLAEGRKVQDPAALRALPYRDLAFARPYEWFIRARSYDALIEMVVDPLGRRRGRPLRVLDLGSGLGWLAYRLSERGHEVAAVDLLTNDFDGLGVHRHYDRAFLPVQAEFDRLPFAAGSVDLVIYNGAFHYASSYPVTLTEALRVLAPGGRIAIVDSPLYNDPASGAAMVREREEAFARRHGFRGNTLPTEGYLTHARLAELEAQLALRFERFAPWYGVRWALKPWLARLRRTREPARFELVVGHRLGDA